MRMLRKAAAVVSITLSAGACASAAGGSAAGPESGPYSGQRGATVRVTNNNWATMTVYAVRGTSRVRLGMVNSMATQVFTLPRSVMAGASGLRLLADPIGSNRVFLTPAVYVSAGEAVQFDIQNNLPISSVSVWRSHR